MRRRSRATRGALRVLRGWALAGCSAALAVAAHGMAGGGVPDTALMALCTVLLAWIGTAMADRRPGMPAVLAVLGLSQLSMHVLLSDVVPLHTGHNAPPVEPVTMVATHALATVLTALLLTRAESALVRVGSAVALLLGLLRLAVYPPPVATAGTPLPAGPDGAGHLVEVVLRRVCARRGPPRRS